MKFKRIKLIKNQHATISYQLSTNITLYVLSSIRCVCVYELYSMLLCEIFRRFFPFFLRNLFFVLFSRSSSCRTFYSEFVFHMITQFTALYRVYWILKLTQLSRTTSFSLLLQLSFLV